MSDFWQRDGPQDTAGLVVVAETNARYKFLLRQGQGGLSVAFDMPTLMGPLQLVGTKVFVVHGHAQQVRLLGKSFLDPGDVVVVEAPTYMGAIKAFRSFGSRSRR